MFVGSAVEVSFEECLQALQICGWGFVCVCDFYGFVICLGFVLEGYFNILHDWFLVLLCVFLFFLLIILCNIKKGNAQRG